MLGLVVKLIRFRWPMFKIFETEGEEMVAEDEM